MTYKLNKNVYHVTVSMTFESFAELKTKDIENQVRLQSMFINLAEGKNMSQNMDYCYPSYPIITKVQGTNLRRII